MARTTVEAQLLKLRKAKEALEKKERALLNRTQGKVIARIVQLALDNGITAAQIAEALKDGKASPPSGKKKEKPIKAARAKVAPKYRNPANAAETWTGRGRAPLWAKALQEAGQFETALIK